MSEEISQRSEAQVGGHAEPVAGEGDRQSVTGSMSPVPTVRRVPWTPDIYTRCALQNIEAKIEKLRVDGECRGLIKEIAQLMMPKRVAEQLINKIANKTDTASRSPYRSAYGQLALTYEPADEYEEVEEDAGGEDDDDYSTPGIHDAFEFDIFLDIESARVRGIVRKDQAFTLIEICGFTRVIARAMDEKGELCGYEIEHLNHHGKRQRRVISASRLESDGAGLFQELGEAGLWVSNEPEARSAFRRLLKTWSIDKTVTVYSQPGWHHAGKVFVCPTGEIIRDDGAPDDGARLNTDARVKDTNRGGSLDGWWRGVGSQIWNGDTPQFAFGLLVGAVGPLLPLPDVDNFGVQFFGPTESGKTTTQIIAAGTGANPAAGEGLLTALDKVDGAPEMYFRRGYRAGLHIDDAKSGRARVLGTMLHQATDGRWHTPWTVSSEQPLSELIPNLQQGALVRLIPIDVGALQRIDPVRAAAIKRAARDNYGWVLPEIVKEIMRHWTEQDAENFQSEVTAYATRLPGHNAPGCHRVAHSLGALWAAGELLQNVGRIPENADVEAVILWAWQGWLRARDTLAGTGSVLERALRAIDEWIERGGDGHLQPFVGGAHAGSAWAWCGGDGTLYVGAAKLVEIAGGHVGRRELVKALRDRRRLILPPNPDKNMAWDKVPGHGRILNYRLRSMA